MKGEDFLAWMESRGLNDSSAARTLGISRTTVIKYREEGAPPLVALACAAISAGLGPWEPPGPDAAAIAVEQLGQSLAELKGRL